jgi:hypothetical protein
MAGLVPAIHVLADEEKTWMPATSAGMTTSFQITLLLNLRRLAQAVAAQAFLTLDRHRQSRGFAGTPARAPWIAREFRPAAGTGDTAR